MKTTMNFMDWMIKQADRLEDIAGREGTISHDAHGIRGLLTAYEIGKNGGELNSVPALSDYTAKWRREIDPDWDKFKLLAKKFGIPV